MGGRSRVRCSDAVDAAFGLPVQRLRLRARTDAPLVFPAREGATVGTTLAGAFQLALREVACEEQGLRQASCADRRARRAFCRSPHLCRVPRLVKPESAVHRRSFPTPVLLRAAQLEHGEPLGTFDLDVTLLGDRAVRARQAVLDAIERMGRVGLRSAGRSVGFAAELTAASPLRTVGGWADVLLDRAAPSVLVVFETPTLVVHAVTDGSGEPQRAHVACGPPPLASLLGNAAYELVAWYLEDAEVGPEWDREARDEAASWAREQAEDAAQHLVVVESALEPLSLGYRASRATGREYPLMGFVGTVELAGDLDPALAWLTWLSLARAGQNRAQGFGEVRLWTAPAHAAPPWGVRVPGSDEP